MNLEGGCMLMYDVALCEMDLMTLGHIDTL